METAVLNETIKALNYRPRQVRASLELLAAGKTVPFIARYRKEMTGSLDEVALREIQATYQQLEKLSQRKQEVLTKIAAQEKLTPKLAE